MLHDVVVVGGGPAGLSAATWLARYRRSVLLVDNARYRNAAAEAMHGYLGRDPDAPHRLLQDAHRDLGRYPLVTRCSGTATAVRRDDEGRFVVRVGDDEHAGLRLVLATGVEDSCPDVDGFEEHYGAGVFHCASCDGYEGQGRSVVVLGEGEQVAAFAAGLLDWVRDVVVVTGARGLGGGAAERDLLDRHGIPVVDAAPVAFEGTRGDLRGVRVDDGSVLPAELVFFSIGHEPRLDLARQLGCEVNDEGCLVVDGDGRTSVEGCFAAGDVTPGFQLVAVAAGEGTAAGVACALSLQGEPGAPASPTPAPDAAAELDGDAR